MKELKEIVAENLAYLRKKNNFTQLELAEKLNYSDKSISKWEHGETMPDIEILQKLANIYNVTLDYIVSDAPIEEKQKFYKKSQNKQNQIIISALWVSFVWILAAVIYVYTNIIMNANYWLVFILAIPISIAVLIFFNKFWGNKTSKFILISLFTWVLLFCIYLQLLAYNIWLIFLIALPVQISIILWSQLK